ncbi:hypothetical protein [Cellulomonas sp. ATA003]|uniref:hypothetical protein n=1 Tax=Cellulomonas sp. ATA003 TaxID=3073064 RepID=UPI002872D2E7|nr:hypothetical protein [Cellulomonas sp. ATA003]WNB86537.1 hypothetical protein REH70_04695 [Cellulomonas sp. ATA003]
MERRGLGSLQPLSDDVSAADWLVAAVRDFDHSVGSLVPPVFQAYARAFHPARRHGKAGADVDVSWTEVAAFNGRHAHAGMQWTSITGSWQYLHEDTQPGVWDVEPEEGTLPAAQAEALVQVLARFTSSPQQCFFSVWEGFGALAVPPVARTVLMPQREMRLLTGPLSEAVTASMETPPWEQSPSLWWPADRAWCVATDVDLMSTYIGASSACVQAVTTAADLEAWSIDSRHGITYDSDSLNTVVAPPPDTARFLTACLHSPTRQ